MAEEMNCMPAPEEEVYTGEVKEEEKELSPIEMWAKNEIIIAFDKMKDDYGRGCLLSAAEAFDTLCGKGHSGASIELTRIILNRLIKGLPLTMIEEDEDCWSEVDPGLYQCKRMSALFKHVEGDKVTYSDNNRIEVYLRKEIMDGVEEYSGPWHCGMITRVFDTEIEPITLPYSPTMECFRVKAIEHEDDSFTIEYYIRPDGTRVDLNRKVGGAKDEESN